MNYLMAMLKRAYENQDKVYLIYRNGNTKIETQFIPGNQCEIRDNKLILSGTGDDIYELSTEGFEITPDEEEDTVDAANGAESWFFAALNKN